VGLQGRMDVVAEGPVDAVVDVVVDAVAGGVAGVGGVVVGVVVGDEELHTHHSLLARATAFGHPNGTSGEVCCASVSVPCYFSFDDFRIGS